MAKCRASGKQSEKRERERGRRGEEIRRRAEAKLIWARSADVEGHLYVLGVEKKKKKKKRRETPQCFSV